MQHVSHLKDDLSLIMATLNIVNTLSIVYVLK